MPSRPNSRFPVDLPEHGPPLSKAEESAIFTAKASMTTDEWRRCPGRARACAANVLVVAVVVGKSRTVPRYRDGLASHLLYHLVRAVDNFDVLRGRRLHTYVRNCLAGQANAYWQKFETTIRVPFYHCQKKISEKSSPDIIAAKNVALRTVTGVDPVRAEGFVGRVWRSRSEDDDAPAYDEETVGRLRAALEELPPRGAEALRRYYGIGCEPEGDKEIARRFGVSRARAHVIRHESLSMIRGRLAPAPAPPAAT